MTANRWMSLAPIAAIALIAWLVGSRAVAGQSPEIDQIGHSDRSSSEVQPPSTALNPQSKGRIENVPSVTGDKPLGQVAKPELPKQQAHVPQTKSEQDLCEEIRAKRRPAIQGLDCSRSQLDSLQNREPTPEEALSNEQPGSDALAGQDIPVPDKSIPPIVILTH